MPSDSYSYHLTTQQDGSICGTVSYYYEVYSMFLHESDGWQEEEVHYRDLTEMYEYLLNHRKRPDVTLDGVSIIEQGKPTKRSMTSLYTGVQEAPCPCGQGRSTTRWETDAEGYVHTTHTMECETCAPFYVWRTNTWFDVRESWPRCRRCQTATPPNSVHTVYRCRACRGKERLKVVTSLHCEHCQSVIFYRGKRTTYDCPSCGKKRLSNHQVRTTYQPSPGNHEARSNEICAQCKKEVTSVDLLTLCDTCFQALP
jgi:DNA-directed RNA polymerase subunit RPC12/RpoP